MIVITLNMFLVVDVFLILILIHDNIHHVLIDNLIKNPIDKKAINAVLIKSRSIPSFNNKPITLRGIPYLIRGIAIDSENFGFLFPIKKPKIKKGTIFIKRE